MQYPGSSASLEQDNIAFTDYITLLTLCHSTAEIMTMILHYLLDHVKIYPVFTCDLCITSTHSVPAGSSATLGHTPSTLEISSFLILRAIQLKSVSLFQFISMTQTLWFILMFLSLIWVYLSLRLMDPGEETSLDQVVLREMSIAYPTSSSLLLQLEVPLA